MSILLSNKTVVVIISWLFTNFTVCYVCATFTLIEYRVSVIPGFKSAYNAIDVTSICLLTLSRSMLQPRERFAGWINCPVHRYWSASGCGLPRVSGWLKRKGRLGGAALGICPVSIGSEL